MATKFEGGWGKVSAAGPFFAASLEQIGLVKLSVEGFHTPGQSSEEFIQQLNSESCFFRLHAKSVI